ncbi:MAG: LPXTG cell wall anchor domain-containing protein [Chitinophagales bacterium]|jgi:LPXTG-motif cell wall-anchored protein|nr:LPXTG cell wall anchor domain-containing protein [Chitinophagales bacterium]
MKSFSVLLDEPVPFFIGGNALIPLIAIAFTALIIFGVIFYFRKKKKNRT